MSQTQSCIIVLKPTSFFAALIAEQLPDFNYPYEVELNADNTAYTIPVCDNDEVLLEHLERLFPFMFRHEVTRLLGKELAAKIEADFLDFLYCFKFEMHEQTVLTEASLNECHQWVHVKPRVIDLDWMPATTDDQIDVKDFLQTLQCSPVTWGETVLVKSFDKLSDLRPLMQRYCRPILKNELMKKAAQIIQWPTMTSLQMFHRYFAVEVHTQLVHLH
ncbi:MAG: hypothetical protein CK424_01720 [Legionella sp.]|nr:MAG: hypothetical protein CK424_01720 [Legionella sp.]